MSACGRFRLTAYTKGDSNEQYDSCNRTRIKQTGGKHHLEICQHYHLSCIRRDKFRGTGHTDSTERIDDARTYRHKSSKSNILRLGIRSSTPSSSSSSSTLRGCDIKVVCAQKSSRAFPASAVAFALLRASESGTSDSPSLFLEFPHHVSHQPPPICVSCDGEETCCCDLLT